MSLNNEEILNLSREFRQAVLEKDPSDEMCMALSSNLLALLHSKGAAGSLEISELEEIDHIFIKLPDGQILDVSADQFGSQYQDVYMGPALDIHANPEPFEFAPIWNKLLSKIMERYPDADVALVGQEVGGVLRSMPDCPLHVSAKAPRP